ncbi:MAG: aldo/keto reductase [Rhodospirillales bacterium]|nr:MAG: aldo/keto reductase [Rhodospirillales bacterium]
MEKRKLGRSGIETAPLTFGGNVFGWTADTDTSCKLIDAFLAGGFDFIDTADVYSRWAPGNQGGESELAIGEWIRRGGARSKVKIATKVGMNFSPERGGLKKDYVIKSCEDSLKRLKTDYIDLYQSHRDDETVPLHETLEAYAELIKQGKVRAIGASNYGPKRLALALEVSRKQGLPRYESLQPHYNLCERKLYEGELEDLCRKEDLGVIGYYSLASGFLTGKYRSEADAEGKPRGAGVKKYMNDRGFGIVETLRAVASETKSTPTQVALAWLIARPGVTAPIVSATSVKQLEEVLGAADVKLDAGQIARLDAASAT